MKENMSKHRNFKMDGFDDDDFQPFNSQDDFSDDREENFGRKFREKNMRDFKKERRRQKEKW